MEDKTSLPKTDTPAPPPAAAEQEVSHPKKRRGLFSSLVADVIGGVSGTVAAGLGAWVMIREQAYKNMTSFGLGKKIKNERGRIGRDIETRRLARKITAKQASGELSDLGKKTAADMENLFADMGVHNTGDRWSKLRGHQRGKVVIEAIIGGVALGAVVLAACGLFTKEEQDQLAGKGGNDHQR